MLIRFPLPPRRFRILLLLLTCAVALLVFRSHKRKTVAERLAQYGKEAQSRLMPSFRAAGIEFPPANVILLFVKDEKRLKLYAASEDGRFKRIKSYMVTAASGTMGPKLKEGDRQVPEGVYRTESLNPNSRYHLSLRLNYPNKDDQAFAKMDGRTKLGGDIMIHGKAASIGCIAIGDPAIEEVFTLAAVTKPQNVRVISTPIDFRKGNLPDSYFKEQPEWLPKVYAQIKELLADLPQD